MPTPAALAAFATPVPKTRQAKYRAKAQKTPDPTPPTHIDTLLHEAGVPPTLAAQLSQRCLTTRQAQLALQHWTGACHLTGMALVDEPAMLQPVQRPDGTFVCRAAQELQQGLSDAMLVQLCERVVMTARQRQHPVNPNTQRPQPTQHAQEAQHGQEHGMELRDSGLGVEEHQWAGNGHGPADPGDGQRGRMGDAVEEFLLWAEGGAVPA